MAFVECILDDHESLPAFAGTGHDFAVNMPSAIEYLVEYSCAYVFGEFWGCLQGLNWHVFLTGGYHNLLLRLGIVFPRSVKA